MGTENGNGAADVSALIRRSDLGALDAPTVVVEITKAAADHVAAWDVDQRVKAVHEAGHAVVARLLGIGVKAIDIKGRRGGHTTTDEEDDDVPDVRPEGAILASIAVALAGGEAEALIIGQRTSGCARDVLDATREAYTYVHSGMDPEAPLFHLDGAPYESRPAAIINAFGEAVARILGRQRDRARTLVGDHRAEIEALTSVIYVRRRLTDDVLEVELDRVGLPPARGRPRSEADEDDPPTRRSRPRAVSLP